MRGRPVSFREEDISAPVAFFGSRSECGSNSILSRFKPISSSVRFKRSPRSGVSLPENENAQISWQMWFENLLISQYTSADVIWQCMSRICDEQSSLSVASRSGWSEYMELAAVHETFAKPCKSNSGKRTMHAGQSSRTGTCKVECAQTVFDRCWGCIWGWLRRAATRRAHTNGHSCSIRVANDQTTLDTSWPPNLSICWCASWASFVINAASWHSSVARAQKLLEIFCGSNPAVFCKRVDKACNNRLFRTANLPNLQAMLATFWVCKSEALSMTASANANSWISFWRSRWAAAQTMLAKPCAVNSFILCTDQSAAATRTGMLRTIRVA